MNRLTVGDGPPRCGRTRAANSSTVIAGAIQFSRPDRQPRLLEPVEQRGLKHRARAVGHEMDHQRRLARAGRGTVEPVDEQRRARHRGHRVGCALEVGGHWITPGSAISSEADAAVLLHLLPEPPDRVATHALDQPVELLHQVEADARRTGSASFDRVDDSRSGASWPGRSPRRTRSGRRALFSHQLSWLLGDAQARSSR